MQTDLGRSIEVATASQPVWVTGVRANINVITYL